MAEAISSAVIRYLQHRVDGWIKSGHTGAELALRAGISTERVSQVRNGKLTIGIRAAESLGRVFGLTLPELWREADLYAAEHPGPSQRAPPSGGPLASHPRWTDARAQAGRDHPEIDASFFEEAGALVLSGGLPAYIDAAFIAGLARELRDRRAREEALAGDRSGTIPRTPARRPPGEPA